MAEHPPRPASERPEELNFVPQRRMVRWLSPRQLAGTALRVVLSQIFGAYSDKREIQASLPAGDPISYADRSTLRFDYVADMGDAFEPTYSIASLLARPELRLEGPGGTTDVTPRGQLLVMGGDQVYPTASVEAYENQLVGPYRAALPYCDVDPPDLFVIPANHDWYDGLTAFMRVFCRQQWIGGWRTRQTRSYWSVQLPHRWWLWGIDVQLNSYIDEPQFRYFQEAGRALEPGDGIILCVPMPSWVKATDPEDREAYVTLDYFERKLVRPRGAAVQLTLTGDHHHYARYVSQDGRRHKITAGGGGAFLSETHHLAGELTIPPPESKDPGKSSPAETYQLAAAFPDRPTSRRLRWRAAALPFLNVSFWALIGGVYLAFAWMIQASASDRVGGRTAAVVADLSYAAMVKTLARSPLAVLLAVVLAAGLVGFTQSKTPGKRFPLGLGHAVVHLALIVVVFAVSAEISSALFGTGTLFVVAFAVLVGVGGGLLGSWVMAAYLIVADAFFALNSNELFAAQRNRDYKCFLRVHLDDTGRVTVYPIGLPRTSRRFKLDPSGVGNEPWYEPEGDALAPRLIEAPIRVERPANGAAP